MLIDDGFFTPAVLPSLRVLTLHGKHSDGRPVASIFAPPTPLAATLRHLSLLKRQQDVHPAIFACTSLLSLEVDEWLYVDDVRFARPLISLRLHCDYYDNDTSSEDTSEVVDILEDAFEAGLINAGTVVVFPSLHIVRIKKLEPLRVWSSTVGMRVVIGEISPDRWKAIESNEKGLEYFGDEDYDEEEENVDSYARFTRWVDTLEEQRRIAVVEDDDN